MSLFDAWFDDRLDIFRHTFGMITLIPKENDARSTKKFRQISLPNCSFRIFCMVLTNRLARIIGRLISLYKYDFIKGRFILESVVTAAHEIVHEIYSKK
jgi:hypothetical protein